MLSARKQKALEALLVSSTRTEAAAKIGADRKTISNYFHDEEFVQAYKEAFAVKLDETTRQAQQALAPALQTLTSICTDENAAPMARVSASRALLEYGLRLGEQNDLAERVAELERQTEE